MKDSRKTGTTLREESHGSAASVWSDLGRESMAAGDLSEALWHLRQAVENDSDYVSAWQLLGKCFRQMGEEARAQRCFRLALRLSSKQSDEPGRTRTHSSPMVVPQREPQDS